MEFSELIKDEDAYELRCSQSDVDGDALKVYAENVGGEGDTIDELIEAFYDAYCGVHRDMGDFAQELAVDVLGYDFSSLNWPLNHIDWEDAANELRYDYWSDAAPSGDIYVFRNI